MSPDWIVPAPFGVLRNEAVELVAAIATGFVPAASTFVCWAPQVSAIVSFDQRSNVILTLAPILCRPCSRTVPGAPLSTTCNLVPDVRAKPLSQPRSTHGAGGASGSKDDTVVASNMVGVAVSRFTGAKYPRTRRTAGGRLGCITNAGVLIALQPPRSSRRLSPPYATVDPAHAQRAPGPVRSRTPACPSPLAGSRYSLLYVSVAVAKLTTARHPSR